MRILIVKLSAIGDVLHTLPVLTALRRHLPGAHLSWLVEDGAGELLRDHPALNHRLLVPRSEWRHLRRGARWRDLGRSFVTFARDLRRTSYDLVIDLQGLAKSGIWVALARATRKAGFGPGLPRNEGAWLALNERVTPPSAEVHALDRGLLLLERLGYPPLPITYDLPVFPAVRDSVTTLLAEAGVPPGKSFIAINPMTRWPTKNWNPQGFAGVADGLLEAGHPVVFTGAPGDRADVEAIVAAMRGRAVRLEGRTDLRQLAEVYRRARLVVSTDTGPMHLAVAVGTPVHALFGPTAPWRTGPHGTGHEVMRLGLSCSPCYRRECRTDQYESRACLQRMEAQQVLGAVLRRLSAAT